MSSHPVSFDTRHPGSHRAVVRILAVFTMLCLVLVTIRIAWTGSFRYLWLLWNLFLAWLPYFFVLAWHRDRRLRRSTLRSTGLLGTWLLFFPNAPYLLTDLYHLIPFTTVPVWYDLILILSFAWTGLLIGFLSLIEVQHFFRHKFGRLTGWAVATVALVLGSFGVYLGRYGRFNSWDVIRHPFRLSRQVLDLVFNPAEHVHSYAMIFFFSCFLILAYVSLTALMEARTRDLTDNA